MQYILLAFVAVGFLVVYGRIWLRRHREAPLRREINSREITFRTRLSRVKLMEPGWRVLGITGEVPINAPMELIVRGDAFDISAVSSLGRLVMGWEYYFRAPEASVEIQRPIPRIYGMGTGEQWILLRGPQADKGIQLWIAEKDNLRDVWIALVSAGAVPRSAGPAPPESNQGNTT